MKASHLHCLTIETQLIYYQMDMTYVSKQPEEVSVFEPHSSSGKNSLEYPSGWPSPDVSCSYMDLRPASRSLVWH
jgi:hypothetical protein